MNRRIDTVQQYIKGGGTGTVLEIAHALEIPAESTRAALNKLADMGKAAKIGERVRTYRVQGGITRDAVEAVWGAPGRADRTWPAPTSIVGRALAARPILQQVWP
jgi:hypothetical protein